MSPIADLRHDAFVYETDGLFAGQVASFLRAGIEEDAATVVVLNPRSRAVLRETLGEVAELVSLTADPDEFYTRPAEAISGYDATLRELVAAGRPSVRVVGELPSCSSTAEWDAWQSYEAILNHVFTRYPAWILCAYDTRVLPDRVVKGAWHTHEQILTDSWQASAYYDDPENVVRSLVPASGGELAALPVPADDRGLRDVLEREMAAAGVAGDRARDMLVAATEVAINARRHGGGITGLRAGNVEGRFVCEISDAGPGLNNPLAGYLPPPRVHSSGAGLWLARQLTLRIELVSPGQGLTVRLWL